jgi:hypothetical protein
LATPQVAQSLSYGADVTKTGTGRGCCAVNMQANNTYTSTYVELQLWGGGAGRMRTSAAGESADT